MTVPLRDIVSFLDTELQIDRFRDYGKNGLQVEGSAEVTTVVTGVSANIALFERALAMQADLIVVHHGLVWGGGIASVTGTMAKRLKFLLRHDMSLCGYHLPLDKHPRLGNNVGLCDAIGLGMERGDFGDVRGHALGMTGSWPEPLTRDQAIARIGAGTLKGATPRFVFAHGPDIINKVGLCTGAASDMLEDAAREGCDLYLTGELAERAGAVAKELGITLVAAGHHATEVFGAMRLASELARAFRGLRTEFIDVPSPL